MNQKEVEELLNRFKKGETTAPEEVLLKYWLHHHEEETARLNTSDFSKAEKEMWEVISPSKIVIPFYKRYTSIAAAVILFIGVSASIYFYTNNKSLTVKNKATVNKKIEHGGNKAILTLADGKKIILDEAANGELAKVSGIKITKAADGRLVYSIADQAQRDGKILFNTIETPKGGQYQINLPDGSSVWLNAASKLTFPTRFIGSERKVNLSGEGYFEITKNKKMPFKVVTALQEVEVLGTHFNINSYTDEANTKTTLVEGSVKVKLLNEQQSSVLKPGEQAVNTSNKLKIDEVDVEAVIAWKNGYFRFDDEELESIMHKVERWYNVDVVYNNEKMKSEKLGGITTRFSEVGDLLKMLELTGKVKFKIEGQKILVLQPN